MRRAAVLLTIFLLSGFAALVYQVVWQRVLFRIYGIDITSVTVVVTAFMLGLGVGSLVGGALTRLGKRWLLPLFAGCELGIALFGVCSLALFEWVAAWTLGVPRLLTGGVAFGLVLVPTMLMGASLPLLVEYASLKDPNVGRAVGLLYFINTLGAALGAFCAALFLLALLGLHATVLAAAALNFVLAVGIWAVR